MRHLTSLTIILMLLSCDRHENTMVNMELRSNFTIRQINLSDSLGIVTLSVPNRYDTFYTFGYNPGCGLAIEKMMHKYQPKKLVPFHESGMIDTTEPKLKDQLIVSQNKVYPLEKDNDSTIIYSYHQRRRHDIMMSPYHGILERDFVEKLASGFQSTFVMNLEDTVRPFFHKEVITSIFRKNNFIVFEYLYTSNKKDSTNDTFIKTALESVKTIKFNNGY